MMLAQRSILKHSLQVKCFRIFEIFVSYNENHEFTYVDLLPNGKACNIAILHDIHGFFIVIFSVMLYL